MLVQKLRLQHGWSQQQLAELSGLSVRTIQRVENGHLPSVETLKSLASVFEIEFTQLASEDNPVNNDDGNENKRGSSCLDRSAAGDEKYSAEERLAFRHVRKVKAFYMHLLKYAAINAGLALLNWVISPHEWWVQWVVLGWGIGLLAHAASTFEFLPAFGPNWEKKQVEKRLGRSL